MAYKQILDPSTGHSSSSTLEWNIAGGNSPFSEEYVDSLIPELSVDTDSHSTSRTRSMEVSCMPTEMKDDYGLQINLDRYMSLSTMNHTYSTALNKLYVSRHEDVPVQFTFKRTPPESCIIRAACSFVSPQQSGTPVLCCKNDRVHSVDEYSGSELFIRAQHQDATIHKDLNGHVTVCVPVQSTVDTFTEISYSFPCLTSHVTRDKGIIVIFTLERDGELLGRVETNVRVCVSTGRDRKSDEENVQKSLGQKRKTLAENEVPLSSHEEKTALTLYVTPVLHAVVKKIAMDLEDEVTKIISKH